MQARSQKTWYLPFFKSSISNLLSLPLHTALVSDGQMMSRLWRGVEIPLKLEKKSTKLSTEQCIPYFPSGQNLWDVIIPNLLYYSVSKGQGLQTSPGVFLQIVIALFISCSVSSIFRQSKPGVEITRLRSPNPFDIATKIMEILNSRKE